MSAGSIAGYFSSEQSKSLGKNVRSKLLSEYDLWQTFKINKPDVSIFAADSASDHGSYYQTVRFIFDQKYHLNIRTHELMSQGHKFSAWLPLISNVLNWFGSEFKLK